MVAVARGALGTKKIGHAGTLDPFATGLLVLATSRATRLLEYLIGLDKEYDATAILGIATDSLDPDGALVREDANWRTLAAGQIVEVAGDLVGQLEQTPPKYSAVKIRGVPAHRRARRGEDFQLPVRTVAVNSFAITEIDLPTVRVRVACSSGTYIRSLAEEFGARLGTACHLTALRRVRVGSFAVSRASSVESLRAGTIPADAWVRPISALAHLPRMELTPDQAAIVSNGQRVPTSAADGDSVACALPGGEIVAVGEIRHGMLRPKKVFPRA